MPSQGRVNATLLLVARRGADLLLLSDRFASAESLQDASKAIKAGESPALDPEMLAKLMATLPPRGSDRLPIGCRVAVWIRPIVVVVALAGFVVWLFRVR